MPIQFNCPQCGKEYKVPDAVAGRKTPCRQCGNQMIVPSPPPAADPFAPPDTRAEAVGVLLAEAPSPLAPAESSDSPFFEFSVAANSSGDLAGIWRAQLNSLGLYLRQGNSEADFRDRVIPVGSPSRYLDGRQFEVSLDDGGASLAVSKRWCNEDRLAHDLASFLNRQRPMLEADDYRLPWYCGAVLLVPLAVALVAVALRPLASGWLGAFVWGVLGVALGYSSYRLVQVHSWSIGRRLATVGGLAAGSLVAVVFALLIQLLLWPSYAAWQEIPATKAHCRVTMPGNPVHREDTAIRGQAFLTTHTYSLERPFPNILFSVACAEIAQVYLDGDGWTLSQRLDGARNEMVRRSPGSELISEKPWLFKGSLGRHLVIRFPNNGIGVFRICMVQRRFYILTVAGLDPESPLMYKFFDSFEPT